MTALGLLVKSTGLIGRGLVLLHGKVDLTKLDNASLHDALDLLEVQGRLVERARRRVLKELSERAFVRAMRSSNEGGAPCVP